MRPQSWSYYTFGQLALVLGLIFGFQTQWAFLTHMIMADSLFTSLNFLSGMSLSGNLNGQSLSGIDKYSFYLTTAGGLWLMEILTWSYLTIVWQTVALIVTCPHFQQDFFNLVEVQDILNWYHQKQQKVVQTVLCYSLSRVINSLAKLNLQTDPKISYQELMTDIKLQNAEPIWRFLKIFLVNTLIKILGDQDSYKMRLLRYFYQHGHVIDIPTNQGSILPTNVEISPKQTLKLVVAHRRWRYLYDPRVLNGLIELYQSNQTPYFEELYRELSANLRYRSLKFGTIWTICSLLDQPMLFPVISMILEIRLTDINRLIGTNKVQSVDYTGSSMGNYRGWGNWVFKPLAFGLYGSHTIGYLSGALISEFGPLLDTQASNFWLTELAQRWPRIKATICHQNQFNRSLITYLGLILMIEQCTQTWFGLGWPLNVLLLIMTSLVIKYREPERKWLWYWLVSWGWFSNYNWMHLSWLTGLLYLIINLKNYRLAPIANLDLNLYHSYYHGSYHHGSVVR